MMIKFVLSFLICKKYISMFYLLLVSLIWAFSFSLIKVNLSGINPFFIAMIRMGISTLVFLPFIKKNSNWRVFLLLGAVQFGLMYLFYLNAFKYLKAYEIALFTISTPIFVTLINDILNKKFNFVNFFTSFLVVVGAFILRYKSIESSFLIGFLLMQCSNISFAIGHVFYKRYFNISKIKDYSIFAYLYIGAFIVTLIPTLYVVDMSSISISNNQLYALLYLGVLPSGVGFFLWNYGVRRSSIGISSIFNNLKIPLAISVSLLFFKETTNLTKLLLSFIIMVCAIYLNKKFKTDEIY